MERLLLVDPSTSRISTIYNQRLERSIGVLCYHNLTQHYEDYEDFLV
jgi:hypothetical protein